MDLNYVEIVNFLIVYLKFALNGLNGQIKFAFVICSLTRAEFESKEERKENFFAQTEMLLFARQFSNLFPPNCNLKHKSLKNIVWYWNCLESNAKAKYTKYDRKNIYTIFFSKFPFAFWIFYSVAVIDLPLLTFYFLLKIRTTCYHWISKLIAKKIGGENRRLHH